MCCRYEIKLSLLGVVRFTLYFSIVLDRLCIGNLRCRIRKQTLNKSCRSFHYISREYLFTIFG
jgi:hypothetical protein